MPKQLHLGGFQIASQVTHSHAAWRHPGSDTDFTSPEYYHRIGRILERGKFDFVFFADLLAAPAQYGRDITEPLRRGTQATATLDPSIVAASIGAVTSKLGVAITKSATFFHPYELARIFASLDHITRGRVAWNIVTSLTASEAQNFGQDSHLDHEFRYERAEEFLRATLDLWSSWDPDALVLDKNTGVFADPDKIRRVEHDGKFFRTRGPLNVPRSPQGRPVLIQAGSSNTGRDFAARWAEAIFEIDPTPEGRRAYYDDIKSRASNFGRNPDQVLIFPAFIPFIGETESIAREKQAFHNELADPISGLITLSVHTDHDFSRYDLDAPVEDVQVTGTQGLVRHRPARGQPRQPDTARYRQVVRPGGAAAAIRRHRDPGRRSDRRVVHRRRGRRLHGVGRPESGNLQRFRRLRRPRAAAARVVPHRVHR